MNDESNIFNDRESVDERLLNNSVRPAVAIPVMIESPMGSMNSNIEEFNFNFTPESRQVSATKGLPRPFDISQSPLIYKTFKQNLNSDLE